MRARVMTGTPLQKRLARQMFKSRAEGFVRASYGVSQENEDFRFRMAGMALTFTTIGISVLLLLGSSFTQLL
jgi:hypothetical protein